jgi:hypothetical protein
MALYFLGMKTKSRGCRRKMGDALETVKRSPEFAYYVRQFPICHTILGAVAVCLPTGLVVLAIFYLIRRPPLFFPPQPCRAALTPFTESPSD